jgi:hypothetical protein
MAQPLRAVKAVTLITRRCSCRLLTAGHREHSTYVDAVFGDTTLSEVSRELREMSCGECGWTMGQADSWCRRCGEPASSRSADWDPTSVRPAVVGSSIVFVASGEDVLD